MINFCFEAVVTTLIVVVTSPLLSVVVSQESQDTNFASLTDFTLIKDGLYRGELRSGIPHGQGVVLFFTDDPPGRYNYTGSLASGRRHGQGTTTFRNGDMHSGVYKKGRLRGKGIIRFANGDVFEGFFVNGKRQGNGILVYSNGTRREGEWKRGKLHGLVFLHRATITTVERWDNGVLMDRGRNATEAASSQGTAVSDQELIEEENVVKFPAPSEYVRSTSSQEKKRPFVLSSKSSLEEDAEAGEQTKAREAIAQARSLSVGDLRRLHTWLHED